MTELSSTLLNAATGCGVDRANKFATALNETCQLFHINTPARLAAFLAQIGHESGGLRYVAEGWGPTEAQSRYDGRKDLGNTEPGDGFRFKGRGLIQTTGRYNYGAVTKGLRAMRSDTPDFVAQPEMLEQLPWAALSAGWYWDNKKLNALADAGQFEAITRKINGGLNGQADRLKRYAKAQQALAAAPPSLPPVEDRSTYSVNVQLENDMSPFVWPAMQALAEVVPKLAGLFSSGSEVAERNVAAVETVMQVAKQAIGAANEQDLVERMQSDPGAAVAVREAIQQNWFEIQQQAEASRTQAREFVKEYVQAKDVRTVAGNFTFPELLTIIVVCIAAAGVAIVLLDTDTSSELRASVITFVIVGGFSTVLAFWFGSSPSEQSAAKKQGVGPSAGG